MNIELLAVAELAARDAGQIILAALNQPRRPDYKGQTDLVTKTDRECEDLIIKHINSEFPGHSILAEESGAQDTKSDYQWVIDPLDGTTNFVHGYPAFAVSIGVLINGVPTIGVVVEMPNINLYTAIKGKGAFVEGKPISVSTTSDLIQSLLVTGFGYEHGDNWNTNMDLFKSFTHKTQGVRRLGAAAVDICHVACGKVDGYWEFDLSPWDSAAGIIIAAEAGAMITRMDGGEYSIYDDQILISNGQLHDRMLQEIKVYL